MPTTKHACVPVTVANAGGFRHPSLGRHGSNFMRRKRILLKCRINKLRRCWNVAKKQTNQLSNAETLPWWTEKCLLLQKCRNANYIIDLLNQRHAIMLNAECWNSKELECWMLKVSRSYASHCWNAELPKPSEMLNGSAKQMNALMPQCMLNLS